MVLKVSTVAPRRSMLKVLWPLPPIRKLLPPPPFSAAVPLVPLASMKSLPLTDREIILELFDELTLVDEIFDDVELVFDTMVEVDTVLDIAQLLLSWDTTLTHALVSKDNHHSIGSRAPGV